VSSIFWESGCSTSSMAEMAAWGGKERSSGGCDISGYLFA
jgi:hypothetical protein